MFRSSITRRLATCEFLFGRVFTVESLMKNPPDFKKESVEDTVEIINTLAANESEYMRTVKNPDLKKVVVQGAVSLYKNKNRIDNLSLTEPHAKDAVLKIYKLVEYQNRQQLAMRKDVKVSGHEFNKQMIVDKTAVYRFGAKRIADQYFESDLKNRKNMMRHICSKENSFKNFRDFIEDDNCRILLTSLIREFRYYDSKSRDNKQVKGRHGET